MKVHLATAILDDIRWAGSHRLVDGVLTTHEAMRDAQPANERELLQDIVRTTRGTVFATAHALTADDVYRDARELAKISDQIIVQVPFIEDVIDAMHRLASDGIHVAATLVFSPAQALVASRVGASAVVIPMDDLDGAGHDAISVLRDVRAALDGADCESDLIAFHPTTSAQFGACAAVGADATAVSTEMLRSLLVHPLTDRGIDQALQVLSRQHASWSIV
jgi:transaldolase